jgi:anti-anti-sigma factor
VKSRLRTAGDAAVLHLSGQIVIGNGDAALTDAVNRILDRGAARKIVIDLARVSYMDSSGLGALVACRRTAAAREVPLVLLRPAGKVNDLLQLTGLGEMFRVFEDEGEALARE